MFWPLISGLTAATFQSSRNLSVVREWFVNSGDRICYCFLELYQESGVAWIHDESCGIHLFDYVEYFLSIHWLEGIEPCAFSMVYFYCVCILKLFPDFPYFV